MLSGMALRVEHCRRDVGLSLMVASGMVMLLILIPILLLYYSSSYQAGRLPDTSMPKYAVGNVSEIGHTVGERCATFVINNTISANIPKYNIIMLLVFSGAVCRRAYYLRGWELCDTTCAHVIDDGCTTG